MAKPLSSDWPTHQLQTNKSAKVVKPVIKFSVYLDFLYSAVNMTVRGSERVCKKEEREAKFSFELLIISSQTDQIITGPHFFFFVWAWACST